MRAFFSLAIVSLLPFTALAQPGDPAKAALAWNLPWDADWVTAVSFVGPNKLAAGNNLGDILLWELPGEPKGGSAPLPVRRLVGHTNTVNRLLPTPDGKLLSASSDHTIRSWDLSTPARGEETVVLNARAIREASEKKNRKVPPPLEAKVATQEAERVLTGHKDWVLGLGLSRDGNTLISGDDKGEVIVWDRPAGKEVRRWKTKGWVWGLAVAPDGSMVCISERKPLVFDSGRIIGLNIWDVAKGTVKHDLSKLTGKEQIMAAAAFAPDGKTLAVIRGGESGGQSGKVTLIDAADGKKLRETTPGHLDGGTDVLFHPQGKYVFSAGRDTLVRVWEIDTGKLVKELGKARGGQFKDWIHSVAVSPDGRWLAAADMMGQVQVWALNGK